LLYYQTQYLARSYMVVEHVRTCALFKIGTLNLLTN